MKLVFEKCRLILLVLGLLVLDQLPVALAAIWREDRVLTQTDNIIVFILELVAILIFYLYGKRHHLLEGRVFLSKRVIKIMLIVWLVMRIPNLIGSWIMALEGVTDTVNQEALTELITQLPISLMALFTVIGAPLMEEIIFRHIIPKQLFKGHQKIGFAVGTLAFAALHGPTDLGSFIIYAGMGAIFSYVYYKYERLEYTILAHFFNNALAFGLMILFLQMG